MNKLIVTILIVAAAWFLWSLLVTPVKVTVVSSASQTSTEVTTQALSAQVETNQVSLTDPPVVRSSELVVIRGYVGEFVDGVMIVDCEPDPVKQGFAWNVDAGSGAAGIAQLAKLASEDSKKEVEKEFGPLKMMSNGAIRSTSMKPDERLIGRFAIYGYPGRPARIHIAAAPTGKDYKGIPLYAAIFQLGSSTAAAAHSLFPPGVDTPEQRREYLKALVEARKNQGKSPSEQRRSVRERGY